MATEKPMQKKHNRGGARPGAGRPAFVPTADERKNVETLSGYGLPIDQIAVLVRDGISVDTLRAHFEAELKSGKAKANGQIAQTLFQKAMSGSETAMIWWTKAQMRWSERHERKGLPPHSLSCDAAWGGVRAPEHPKILRQLAHRPCARRLLGSPKSVQVQRSGPGPSPTTSTSPPADDSAGAVAATASYRAPTPSPGTTMIEK